MDCQYYKSRKSDWGYSGGTQATQWCSHPDTNGLACDTDKCPKAIEELENDSCGDSGNSDACGVCGNCQIYADHTYDLMREEGH